MFKRETSELSDGINKVKKFMLESNSIDIVTFEGCPTKSNRVTALFDKFICDSIKNENNLEEYFKENFLENSQYHEEILRKVDIINKSDLRWFVLVHDEDLISVLFRIESPSKFHKVNTFRDPESFANWFYYSFSEIRERISRYEEKNLPIFDKRMRKSKKPWPGNVDGILFFDNSPKYIIEFQTTKRYPVIEHDNNDWMKATTRRKGDAKRWQSIKNVSETLKLPILVAVWSPNEDNFKLRKINSFRMNNGLPEKIIWEEDYLYDDVKNKNFDRLIFFLNR
ncbi:hypothetical protein LAKU_13c00330 [Apilactobacillus kunkeei EFB6]|uniref:Uncharacterized protein n=1 Tax=Apilactobacillus kunkeei EFB6 TaxID=1419324 RepID=A0A837ADP5_9LACO|nr:hypothetical protein [Apilactobacillus kunkeei]KDB00837.1 hypothetical protein LAKU_13c00330 [Apilactobacillus kunkeei EFB6]CAI2555478.1 hypothetical protein AKUH3B203M01_00330 [Apilactobacillus kunkeei]CAI2555797.1 hypothetical protein AKUH3B203M_01140 [Apilactobacillus kunkeei]CAI2801033.1 hypothetical protein AKUH3B203M04_05960 [Apilactobacillus kunkeei]